MKVVQNIFLIATLTAIMVIGGVNYAHSQNKAATESTVSKIVLDAGHGGKDPGTVHGNIHEKDITLKVALMLGKMIEANFDDVKVIYTRTTDVFIPLDQRGIIANKAGADLFLSIHVDAAKNLAAEGNSSFIMGLSKSKANLEVAMRENEVVTYEENFSTKYMGYTPGDPDSYIIFSLMQYATSDQSMQFASIIQKNYKKQTPFVDRGSKQEPFFVLWRTTMPSVLTEIGFMSNEHDRKFLTSNSGQNKVVTALFNAFSEYKSKVEGSSTPIVLSTTATNDEEIVAATPKQESCIFTIQVCSSTKKMSLNSHVFKGYKGKVTERKVGKVYKYTIGECVSYKEGLALQNKVRKEIKDAFITAFRGNEQVNINEARNIK